MYFCDQRYIARFSVGKSPLKCTETRQHGVDCCLVRFPPCQPQNVDHSTLRQALLNKVRYRGKADDLWLHSVDDDGHVISNSHIKGSLNSGTKSYS